ncbi:MAG: DNA/RNA non-specific endonuclease [Saprospiraceae bacterium]
MNFNHSSTSTFSNSANLCSRYSRSKPLCFGYNTWSFIAEQYILINFAILPHAPPFVNLYNNITMRKNLILILAYIFLPALADVNAQSISGALLPQVPSTSTVETLEKDVAAKSRQLEAAELQFEQTQLNLNQSRLLQLGLPKLSSDSDDADLQKRAYPGYIVGFSRNHGQSQWSTHIINSSIFQVCNEREESFFEDLSLTGAPLLENYVSSGFQRGHMAPAADFRWSPIANKASNILSNCAPQPSEMNEGLWAKLEIGIRNYLEVRPDVEALMVVTGPVLKPSLSKLNGRKPGNVSIPDRFFKVVLNRQDQQGFAFLMETNAPDKTSKGDIEAELRKRMMSIDSLEKLLQIDFFTRLSSDQEKTIEAVLSAEDFFSLPGVPPFANLSKLVDGAMNTAMLTSQNLKDCKSVIGTVIDVSVGSGGGVILFLDNPLPKNRVQIHITRSDAKKFSNPSLEALEGKVVQVQGNPFESGGRFRINLKIPSKLSIIP